MEAVYQKKRGEELNWIYLSLQLHLLQERKVRIVKGFLLYILCHTHTIPLLIWMLLLNFILLWYQLHNQIRKYKMVISHSVSTCTVHIYLHVLYMYLSINITLMSVCLSVCLSVYLSVCLSVHLTICMYVCLSVCLFICLSVCTCVSVYLYM